MIRVSAFYPNQPGTTFDHDYYGGKHRNLIVERLTSLGMRRMEVDRGIAGYGGAAAPYIAGGHLYFDSVEDFQSAWGRHGEEIMADIPSFTNAQPVVQISQIAVGGSA